MIPPFVHYSCARSTGLSQRVKVAAIQMISRAKAGFSDGASPHRTDSDFA